MPSFRTTYFWAPNQFSHTYTHAVNPPNDTKEGAFRLPPVSYLNRASASSHVLCICRSAPYALVEMNSLPSMYVVTTG